MPTNLQGRTQYLSLALFSQSVVSALLEFVDQNKSEHLEISLREALRSLEDINSGNLHRFAQRRAVGFSSYEHLQTLDQVWSVSEREEAIRMIGELLTQPVDAPAKKDDANRLINLFVRLENQALWNFEQPRTASPRGIRELCTMP
jgi:hypothetical protein